MAKGKTRWFPRHVEPVRHGEYECLVRLTSNAPLFFWRLRWDGKGFLVPFPMVVKFWRGRTKAATHQPKKGK